MPGDPINFLLWNTFNKEVGSHVGEIAKAHETDVIILIENGDELSSLLYELNVKRDLGFNPVDLFQGDIRILVRFSSALAHKYREESGGRRVILELEFPARGTILLGVVHGPSRLHSEDGDREEFYRHFLQNLGEVETEVGHDRTLVAGDFNADPFERTMVSAAYFHAVPDRRICRKGSRMIDKVERRFFYNPTWGLFGDRAKRPPGNYYYDKSKHHRQYWHLFDQIVLRPSLMDSLVESSLQILDTTGSDSLVTKEGRPKLAISDHLPMVFSLDLKMEEENG